MKRLILAAVLTLPLGASTCATLVGVASQTALEGAKATALVRGRPDIAQTIGVAQATGSVGCQMVGESLNLAASRFLYSYCLGRGLNQYVQPPEVTR